MHNAHTVRLKKPELLFKNMCKNLLEASCTLPEETSINMLDFPEHSRVQSRSRLIVYAVNGFVTIGIVFDVTVIIAVSRRDELSAWN